MNKWVLTVFSVTNKKDVRCVDVRIDCQANTFEEFRAYLAKQGFACVRKNGEDADGLKILATKLAKPKGKSKGT